jgi:hypothetical protein
MKCLNKRERHFSFNESENSFQSIGSIAKQNSSNESESTIKSDATSNFQ